MCMGMRGGWRWGALKNSTEIVGGGGVGGVLKDGLSFKVGWGHGIFFFFKIKRNSSRHPTGHK